jgi:hypothetical protein
MSGTLLMKKKCAAFITMHLLIKEKEKKLKKNKALMDKTSLSNYFFSLSPFLA